MARRSWKWVTLAATAAIWGINRAAHAQQKIAANEFGEFESPHPDFPIYFWILLAVAAVSLAAGIRPRWLPWLKGARGVKWFRIAAIATAVVLLYWASAAWVNWAMEKMVMY